MPYAVDARPSTRPRRKVGERSRAFPRGGRGTLSGVPQDGHHSARELFELADEVGRERALREALADLLEDAVPLGPVVAGEVDHGHLALEAREGGGVLVAD